MPRVTITAADRNPQPYRFQLDRLKVNLGRGSDNDIVVEDGSVSVRHAVMERLDGGYQLRDLGSTNGIKLEGLVQEIIPLRHGLSVKIGDVAFDFTLTEEEREALAREKPPQESPIIKEAEGDATPFLAVARPAPGVVRPVVVHQPSGAGSFFMTLLFLILAAAAFCIGLDIRHRKDSNGKSLLDDMQGAKAVAPATPAADPPADADPAK